MPSALRVHALLLDERGRARAGSDGAAPCGLLEAGESPVIAARRILGIDARWLGTVHAGADESGPFVVLALASEVPLEAETLSVPGSEWTLARERALPWTGESPPE